MNVKHKKKLVISTYKGLSGKSTYIHSYVGKYTCLAYVSFKAKPKWPLFERVSLGKIVSYYFYLPFFRFCVYKRGGTR